MFKSIFKAASNAFKKLHERGTYEPKDLLEIPEYKALHDETNALFTSTIQFKVSDTLKKYLEKDAFIFSGLRTHTQLADARSYLKDEKGNVRSFNDFSQKIQKLNAQYNQNYLEAEYNFAVQSGLSAERWEGFSDDEKRYWLQYRTAKDSKVRDSHAALDETTLPKGDAFWNSYMPPNGWNCRCTTVEVLADDYTKSDSKKAQEKGEKATTIIGKSGKNKAEMFRFNPGKEKKIFPPDNTYEKVIGAKEVKTLLGEQSRAEKTIKIGDYIKDSADQKSIRGIMNEYAQKFPNNFANGFEKLTFRESNSYMMEHSVMRNVATGKAVSKSSITISKYTFRLKGGIEFNPAKELADGFSAIKNGKDLTFNQEYAFESLWHEILHAKTKSNHSNLSRMQRETMETINEFVARHTYPEFIKSFGGIAVHQKEIIENGYGYSNWISEFREDISDAGLKEKDVVNYLKPHLLSDYKNLSNKKKECFIDLKTKNK